MRGSVRVVGGPRNVREWGIQKYGLRLRSASGIRGPGARDLEQRGPERKQKPTPFLYLPSQSGSTSSKNRDNIIQRGGDEHSLLPISTRPKRGEEATRNPAGRGISCCLFPP